MKFNKAFHPTHSFPCVRRYSCTSVLRKTVLWKKDVLKRVKLDLEGKNGPCLILEGIFSHEMTRLFLHILILLKLFVPKHIIEALASWGTRCASVHTNLSATKPKTHFISYCYAICQAVTTQPNKTKNYQTKTENQDQTTNQNFQVFFVSERKRPPSPQFLLYYSCEDYTLYCCRSSICTH